MAILKYEMRQLRFYTLWWSLAAGLFIFSALPVYFDLFNSSTIDISNVGSATIFDMWDFDINILSSPVGTLGFLTSFMAIAAGINGMFLGLKIFTKETVQKSAEFLYTKPFKRSIIFSSKVLAALISAVITGVSYLVFSLLALSSGIAETVDFKAAFLVALSFMLIGIFFVFFGVFIGTFRSKIRTPLLVSSAAAFMFYVLATFSNIVNAVPLKYLTPFAYFNSNFIIRNSSFNSGYMFTFAFFIIAFILAGLRIFIKKDITFIS